jgi:uncharacterized protein (TIGR03435 family)
MRINASRVDFDRMQLRELICQAYRIKFYQLVAPSWLLTSEEGYDIVANLPAGAAKEQVPEMLRALLADRFGLVTHSDVREHDVYGLVVGKGGLKIRASRQEPAKSPESGSSSDQKDGQNSGAASATLNGGGQKRSGPITTSSDGKLVHFARRNVSMAMLAETLAPLLDRPVLDMTGLNDTYDTEFDVSMSDVMASFQAKGYLPSGAAAAGDPGDPALAASDPVGGQSVRAAVRSLGLDLIRTRAPLPLLVVDHAEKLPVAN